MLTNHLGIRDNNKSLSQQCFVFSVWSNIQVGNNKIVSGGIFSHILCNDDKKPTNFGGHRWAQSALRAAGLGQSCWNWAQPCPCEFPVGSKVLESPWAPWLITAIKDHEVSLKNYLSRCQQNLFSLVFCSQHVEFFDCKGSGEGVAISSIWKIRAFSS